MSRNRSLTTQPNDIPLFSSSNGTQSRGESYAAHYALGSGDSGNGGVGEGHASLGMNPLLPNPYSPGLSPGQRVEEEEGERVSDEDGGGEGGEEHHVVGYDGSDDDEEEERGKRVLKVRKTVLRFLMFADVLISRLPMNSVSSNWTVFVP
jgi:hypothetical protein